jgi:hypothetical protein
MLRWTVALSRSLPGFADRIWPGRRCYATAGHGSGMPSKAGQIWPGLKPRVKAADWTATRGPSWIAIPASPVPDCHPRAARPGLPPSRIAASARRIPDYRSRAARPGLPSPRCPSGLPPPPRHPPQISAPMPPLPDSFCERRGGAIPFTVQSRFRLSAASLECGSRCRLSRRSRLRSQPAVGMRPRALGAWSAGSCVLAWAEASVAPVRCTVYLKFHDCFCAIYVIIALVRPRGPRRRDAR